MSENIVNDVVTGIIIQVFETEGPDGDTGFMSKEAADVVGTKLLRLGYSHTCTKSKFMGDMYTIKIISKCD